MFSVLLTSNGLFNVAEYQETCISWITMSENVRYPHEFQNWMEAQKLWCFCDKVMVVSDFIRWPVQLWYVLIEHDMFNSMLLSGNIYLQFKLKGSGTGSYYMLVGYSLLLLFTRDRLCFKIFHNFLYYMSDIHSVAWRETFYWKWAFKDVNHFLTFFILVLWENICQLWATFNAPTLLGNCNILVVFWSLVAYWSSTLNLAIHKRILNGN